MKTNKAICMLIALTFIGGLAKADSSTDSRNELEFEETILFMDLESIKTDIKAELPVPLPFLGNESKYVYLLEFNIFLPGQKIRPVLDENGSTLYYEPFPYNSFRGTLIGDPDSEVFIAMDDRGIYGHIFAFNTWTWFNPVDEDRILKNGEDAETLVRWVKGSDEGIYIQDYIDESAILNNNTILDPQQSKGSKSSPVKVGEGNYGGGDTAKNCIMEIARVQPVADKRFTSKHSNFATRIANGIAAQADMWREQTCIYLGEYAVYAPGWNYSTSSNCSTHLNSFKNLYSPSVPGTDASQLYTGLDMDCQGIGYKPTYSGNIARNPYNLVEAVNHHWYDTYDPDSSFDLGLVSAHELGHNWGERDHPGDYYLKDGYRHYNVMVNGISYNDRYFWFTSGGPDKTADRIIKATRGNI